MRLARERRSVAALEFALIMPVMFTLMAGGFDAARAVNAWEQTESAARAIVECAEKASVQPDGTFSLSSTTAQTAMTAIYAQMPELPTKNGPGTYLGQFSVTLSSLVLTPAGCTVDNANVPCTVNVAWSAVLSEGPAGQILSGAAYRRPCGLLAQGAPGASPSNPLGSVPIASVHKQSNMLVADVQYKFSPMFFVTLTGAVTFWSTAMFPVPGGSLAQDYVQYLPFDPNVVCQGYS